MDSFLDDLIGISGNDTRVDKTEFIRAPFSIAGAKSRSLDQILPEFTFTRHTIWVDEFAGSGCVSWNIPKVKLAIYNDRHAGVCLFYQMLRERKAELKALLETFPNHAREAWEECRSWPHEKDPLMRAAKWLYLTRGSVLGKRNCWARATKKQPVSGAFLLDPAFQWFDPVHQILRHFQIENLDARQCALDFDTPNTIHYMDPPYINTDQDGYEHGWTENDQLGLLELIGDLKGFVALSGFYHKKTDEQKYWTKKKSWMVLGSAKEEKEMMHEHLWIKTSVI